MDIAFKSMTTSGSYSDSLTSRGICDRRWFAGLGDLGHTRIEQRETRPNQTTAVRNKTFQHCQIERALATNANGRGVQFVAFVLYGFLNCRAKSQVVCILRHLAMTTNHFFASFDSDQAGGSTLHTTQTNAVEFPGAASLRFEAVKKPSEFRSCKKRSLPYARGMSQENPISK
jgi:hypothetical protein